MQDLQPQDLPADLVLQIPYLHVNLKTDPRILVLPTIPEKFRHGIQIPNLPEPTRLSLPAGQKLPEQREILAKTAILLPTVGAGTAAIVEVLQVVEAEAVVVVPAEAAVVVLEAEAVPAEVLVNLF